MLGMESIFRADVSPRSAESSDGYDRPTGEHFQESSQLKDKKSPPNRLWGKIARPLVRFLRSDDERGLGMPTVIIGGRELAIEEPGKQSMKRWLSRLAILGVVAAFGLAIVFQLLPPVQTDGGRSPRYECKNHLKQIALALHNYHDDYGCFPPAYVADRNGRPMHSWRVLILPYLDYRPVYQRYRFDEPWDGPHNRALASLTPNIYHCPADKTPKIDTSYVVVVGPTTMFPDEKCVRISDIGDGTTNTIMVVEMVNSHINWMEPRDLTFDQALRGINPGSQLGMSSHHEDGAQAAFADGSVRFFKNDFLTGDLRPLLEINDGKPVPQFPMN
jgi:prepilin-type processing-associated H-X9-DG protein